MFKDLIGKTIEVYMDDMLVKSKVVRDHMGHLRKMFVVLRKYQMKLNPPKVRIQVGIMIVSWFCGLPTRNKG